MTTNAEYVLQTRQLKKYFGSVHAVEDISLNIRHGEIYGFLGPNGSGKTTTISMILGLTYPTSGEVGGDQGVTLPEIPAQEDCNVRNG